MSHSVTYNSEARIVELKVHGTVDQEEARDITSEVLRIAKERNCLRVLSDYRDLTDLNLSTLEIYKLPGVIAELASTYGLQAIQFKRALIVTSNLKDLGFFETVTVNSGQNAKLFQDADQAKTWLTAE